MGYTTDFYGEFTISPPLDEARRDYINAFSETRRMRRMPTIVRDIPDPIRERVGLPVGIDGGYFVGGGGSFGQDHDTSVVSYNEPPRDQPSLWCQWVVSEDGATLYWDGGEKFYSYAHWLAYLIKHFLEPWGHTVNGEVEWQGEDPNDKGLLVAKDNRVSTSYARITFDAYEEVTL